MLRVCFSGGPCSGKSSAQSIVMQALSERGYKVFYVPETATELILSGIIPGKHITLNKFQELILERQLSKEDFYDKVAKAYNTDKVVIIYDRGIGDQLAYISREELSKMLKGQHNMTLADAFERYDCVCHLETAAKGAVEHYQWNDPNKKDCGNNAARSESPEQAIEKDNATLKAWVGHPHLRVFDNNSTFEDKIKRVVEEIFRVLGEPIPLEIERKYLVKKPSQELLDKLDYVSKVDIIQTYLTSEDGVERRVRQRGTPTEGYSYFYTEKREKEQGVREEKEKHISLTEYVNYLANADCRLHTLKKTRYCILYHKQYLELDVYPFCDDYAILEIELDNKDSKVEIPDYLEVIKEVTDDKRYTNRALAESLKLSN